MSGWIVAMKSSATFSKSAVKSPSRLPFSLASVVAWAQKQYYLPTAGTVDDEKDKPMIEVYLPQHPNGCAVVLCPGGAMRWLSWESDVVKMASFLNELMPQTDETTTETWSNQMIHWLKAKGFISKK